MDVRTVRLVVLSGGEDAARRAVSAVYPNAEVETVDKKRLRGGERFPLLDELRRRPCDRFVFFTFVNAWQLDRFRMLSYARLAGGRRAALLDTEHMLEEFGFGRLWLREAPRTLLEYALAGPLVLLSLAIARAFAAVARPRRGGFTNAVRSGDRPLDVLLVRPTPTIGVMEAGESAHIRGVLEGLTELGHRPRVLSNDDLPAVRRAGYPLAVRRPGAFFNATPLAFEMWNNLALTWHLWREVRRRRPDLVYQRHGRNGFAGAVVSRLARLPFLLEWNGSEVWTTRHWSHGGWWVQVAGVFERASQRAADRFVVVSRALKEGLVEDGVDPARIVVNPNGVNPERFRPGAGGEAIRARYGLEGRTLVGFVGSFNYYQGVPALMQAAPEVCRRSDSHFLMIGYGETLEAAKVAAREGGVEDRVTFTGRVSVDEVPAYLDACDVAVAPMVPNPDGSDFFNSPVKIFEYMASGHAIVASRLGQIVDVIEDGETGILVAPDSPEQLAEAIVRLALDPDLRERLGRNARCVAVERHTWRRNAARALEAYDDVVGEGSGIQGPGSGQRIGRS